MFHKNIPNNNKNIIRFLAKNFAGTKNQELRDYEEKSVN